MELNNLNKKIRNTLPAKTVTYLKTIGQESKRLGYNAYLVGGLVRDLVIGYKTKLDLDITVDGGKISAQKLANCLSKKWAAKILLHKQFGTAVVTFKDGTHIDFAFTRNEKYKNCAILPEVYPVKNIEEDLQRRDFTINALAIDLHPTWFGTVIDSTGGLRDIKKKQLRVIHPYSFYDDPTRIWRAARFAGRYGLNIEKNTLRYLRAAVKFGLLNYLSRERIREELLAVLNEPDSIPALKVLAQWGVLGFLHTKLGILPLIFYRGQNDLAGQVATSSAWFGYTHHKSLRVAMTTLVKFLLLIYKLNYSETKKLVNRLVFTAEVRDKILKIKKASKSLLNRVNKSSDLKRIHLLFASLPEEAIIYTSILVPEKAKLLNEYQQKKLKSEPVINGNDLKRLGYTPGPQYREILEKVRFQKISGNLPSTRKSELQFVIDNFRKR